MSTTQNLASPRAPRPKHHHSKSATGAPANANNGGKQPQRRQKNNRAPHSHNAKTQQPTHQPPIGSFDPGFVDSAVLSSEEVPMPTGPRNVKKHAQSQPSTDRVFSPAALASGSLTDSELGPNNVSTTPAKPQGAYAGPTFHASPAPSALPIPKFLSRSVPAKTMARPPTPPEESSDSSSSPVPSPSHPPIAVPARHQDSPLDMLFKADRAERARNANCSPPSSLSSPSNHISSNERLHHAKQNSYSSMNAIFPIELDGETKNVRPSPPVASPVAHRSVTAPSKIPQLETFSKPATENNAVQDLLDRLSFSQKKSTASTPPRAIDCIPAEPSSRNHSPSPFRSASGPTTPVPAATEAPDFFYGNRNLSPLFKAAKTDSTMKRNSGLRTEITADSPLMSQGGFPVLQGAIKMDPAAVSRNYLDNVIGGGDGARRGSAPHIPPQRESPNNRKTRTPGRYPNRARPDSYPYANGNGNANGPTQPNSPNPPKLTTTPFSFVPSSVAAKQRSTTKPSDVTTKSFEVIMKPSEAAAIPPNTTATSLEQDLKRMLNLKISGNTTGVQ